MVSYHPFKFLLLPKPVPFFIDFNNLTLDKQISHIEIIIDLPTYIPFEEAEMIVKEEIEGKIYTKANEELLLLNQQLFSDYPMLYIILQKYRGTGDLNTTKLEILKESREEKINKLI